MSDEYPIPTPGALLRHHCGCPPIRLAPALMLHGKELAKAPCTACRYGLWMLIPRICNEDPAMEWPDDALPVGMGLWAIPNARPFCFDEKLTFPVQQGEGTFDGFRPIATYNTLEEVRWVVNHWADLLEEYRLGARSRLGTYNRDITTCPDGWTYAPTNLPYIDTYGDFGGLPHGSPIDFASGSGRASGAVPTQLEPGTYATIHYRLEIATETDTPDLVWFEINGEQVENFVRTSTRDPAWPAMKFFEVQGEWYLRPCEPFDVKAFANGFHTGSTVGRIEVGFSRVDCPDISEAARRRWEWVVAEMESIPCDSAGLCDYRDQLSILAEMGE